MTSGFVGCFVDRCGFSPPRCLQECPQCHCLAGGSVETCVEGALHLAEMLGHYNSIK